jgi:hypothetical protein
MNKSWMIVLGLCTIGIMAPASFAKKDKSGVDVFAKYDKNGDGKLDDAEKAAIKEAFANDPDLKKYDLNGDGKLDDNEIAAIQPAKKKKKDKNK